MNWNGLVLMAFLVAGPALAQDERPRFSVPEPEKEKRRPAGAFVITELQYQLTSENDRFPRALPELVGFFKGGSAVRKIETEVHWNQLPADSPDLGQTALLYMTGNQAVLQFSAAEKKGLARYLNGGGLLYAEDIRISRAGRGLDRQNAGMEGTPFDQQFKALMRDPLVLGENGGHWEKLAKEHPLYAACYDFAGGPPLGGAPRGNVSDLEMLELRGRAAVIFSDLNISWYWGDPLASSREWGLRFGVNLIVFAMVQRAAGPGLGSGNPVGF
jgi:hypothetical protein